MTLPSDISNKKAAGRQYLAKQTGKDFDEKFIKMITIDHERDVKMFKNAMDQDDKDIQESLKKIFP